MKNKKVFLNGIEITDTVEDIIDTSIIMSDDRNDNHCKYIRFTIIYKNGAIFTAGKDDYVKIVDTTPRPKFKIGDYVVEDAKDNFLGDTNMYIKIFNIVKNNNGEFEYNVEYRYETKKNLVGDYTCHFEKYLRVPTKEELDLYFR